MKKNNTFINILALSFLIISPVSAQEKTDQFVFFNQNTSQSIENTGQSTLEAKLDFSTGYRRDKLNWSIAGDSNGENPNILSELTWEDLQIFQVKANGNILINKQFRIEGYCGYGWIVDGNNQDSDYDGNNRTSEFSRSNNSSDGDNVSDWSVGLGYQLNLGKIEYLACDELELALLGGYSHHNQNLRITNGFQTIDTRYHTYGPFDGLNSTYQAEWKGPWLGAELESPSGKFTTLLRIEYHWADYFAEADWNLRTTFAHPVSYTHTADGKGVVASFSLGYNIQPDWLIFLKTDIQKWDTSSGIDRTFGSNGNTADTQLNSVHWQSSAIMLGLRCRL